MSETLRERDAWPTAVCQEMPCAVLAVDRSGQIVQWNRAAERLFGHAAGDAVGRLAADILRGPLLEGSRVLHHRLGQPVPVMVSRAASLSREGQSAFFLQPTPSLMDATELVVREVLHHLPAYFSIIGPDLRYRLCCRSCEVLYGRARRDIEGQLASDLLGPEATAQAAPLLAQAFAGHSAHGEIHVVGADRKLHILRVHIQPLRSRNDAIDGVFSFAYDITQLRDAEATLRHSESRLKILIECNPDLITIINRQNRVVFINHTEPDPSTPKEALIGFDVVQLSPPEYREWLVDQYDVVWRTGKPVDLEAPIVWRDQLRWFSSRLVALPNGDKPPVEMLIVSRETTQRIAAEHALQESETRFRQFAEALDDVVWIHDINPERIAFVNQAYERVWGVPRQRLYSNPNAWLESIHPADREHASSEWANVSRGTSANFDVEYRIVRPDGAERWIHDFGTGIRDADGRAIRLTGIARDITARKNAEDERENFQQQMLATQKLESLGVLAGGIAHDFNNLLSGILGNVNLAQTDSLAGSSLRTYLDQIESISLRAGDLCKQMLAYAGKGQFIVAAIDLNHLIEEITHLLAISISKKVSLQFHLSANVPPVRGDISQLRQVLLNLVINASEAFGDRVGLIRVSTGETEMTAEELVPFHFAAELEPGPYVFLEVSDNGPGMSAEVLSRIFEPFFTTKFTGRGLGLAAVQGILRSHGGSIRVTSKVGQGSAFTLLLPPVNEAVPLAPPPTPPSPTVLGHGTALIVDDEVIVSSSLALMLESYGFETLIAGNGREGLDTFVKHRSDISVVLLDLTMPILSGEETFRELRRFDAALPIIFMSGYMEQEIADRTDGQGFAGFLQKPFRMEALEQMLANALCRPVS